MKRSVTASVMLLVAVVLTLPTEGRSSPPPPADGKGLPKHLEGRAITPHAGYARSNAVQRFQRLAAAAGAAAQASPRGLEKNRSVLVITLGFKNRPAPFTTAQFQLRLFGDSAAPVVPGRPPLTVTQYYLDMSNNQLNVGGRVVGPYTLPKDDEYYENNVLGSVC
ncbi:MAG: immune inhibitor A [Gemmataceae bacterium]|nr:immune inhibitor A [Gemmataceae bacterium]